MSFKERLLAVTLRSSRLSILYPQKRFYSVFCKQNYTSNLQYFPSRPRNWKVLSSNPLFLCGYSHATTEEHRLNEQTDIQPLKFEDVNFEQPVTHQDLLAVLQKCKSLQDQMEALECTLSLSAEDVQKRINFSKTIENLLKPFFGEIKIQIFGSTMNGFGFKGCDIDMSFETARENEEIKYLESPDVPLVSEVLSGKVSPSEISQLPSREQLIFIHSVLLEYYKESEEPAIFINAYVPLVRFHHDKFNLKCDLTCRNRVAFANTKLMYLFANLDKRVKPLMMTVRYWAKHAEVIGKGLLFNTYTISLMVIYFLQTRNPPILPSAEYIVSLSNSLKIDDMNDKSFLIIRNQIPASKNNQSLDELLKEFFFFYFYFDYDRVICPWTASSIPREEFFMPDRSKKFRNNTICVQDPMLLTHNVADLVDFKTCHRFSTEIMCACRMFQEKMFLNPSDDNWGLPVLFDKPEKYQYINVVSQMTASFSIPFILGNVKVFDQSLDYEEPIHSSQMLLKILQDALLFDCRVVEYTEIFDILKKQDQMNLKEKESLESALQFRAELEFNKKKKSVRRFKPMDKLLEYPPNFNVKQFQELNSSHELILCAVCKTSKNTWHGRDFAIIDFVADNSLKRVLEKEHLISLYTAKQNEENAKQVSKQSVVETKSKQFMFLCECYKAKDSEQSLLVNLRVLERTYFNPVLAIFLKDFVPKIIEKINSTA